MTNRSFYDSNPNAEEAKHFGDAFAYAMASVNHLQFGVDLGLEASTTGFVAYRIDGSGNMEIVDIREETAPPDTIDLDKSEYSRNPNDPKA